jgi:hypothetical protein
MLTRHETIHLSNKLIEIESQLCITIRRLAQGRGDAITIQMLHDILTDVKVMQLPLNRCLREVAAEHSEPDAGESADDGKHVNRFDA